MLQLDAPALVGRKEFHGFTRRAAESPFPAATLGNDTDMGFVDPHLPTRLIRVEILLKACSNSRQREHERLQEKPADNNTGPRD